MAVDNGRRTLRPRWEGVVGALAGVALACVAVGPRLGDPLTTEEASGVRGGAWTALLTGFDAPTNPPVMLWLANALADGVQVVDVGRVLAFAGTTGMAAVVGWLAGRRAGWALAFVAVGIVALLPPLVFDGARVRGYGPAGAALAVHLGAWLALMEAPSDRRARRVRVASAALAPYAHYLSAPMVAVAWGLFAWTARAWRRDARDAAWVVGMWAPTLVWILGDGNPPLVAQAEASAVWGWMFGASVQAAPFMVDVFALAWRPAFAAWLAPLALWALGPLPDLRARALRRVAMVQSVLLAVLGMVVFVRPPAAALALPAWALAFALGAGAVSRWRALLPGTLMAVWLGAGVRHLACFDPWDLQADPFDLVQTLSQPRWAGSTVYVPNRSEFVRLDLVAHGAPFDAPGRPGVVPRCVDLPGGATVCGTTPPASAMIARRLGPRSAPPSGCEAVARGRGWAVLRCGPALRAPGAAVSPVDGRTR